MTPKDLGTGQVRNLLGIPSDDAFIEAWTHDQRRDYILLRIHERVQSIDDNGCSQRAGDIDRIRALESWWPTIKFAGGTLIVAGGVIGFLWAMIQFSKHVQP